MPHIRRRRTTTDDITPRANLLHQSDDQLHIPRCAEHTAQPQARLHLDRHGHAENTASNLGPDLVCLHLSRLTRSLDQVLAHALTVLPRPGLPSYVPSTV